MTARSPDADFRPKARRPRGFQDRRGAQLARERAIVETVLGVYQAWGFERLETSAFEYADALGKFLPDQDRPNEGVFALEDDDSQWMALRYDLTAPLARFVAENYDALPKPYRRCAAGPVWRNEKPGPGRFREFWQCDADTVGAASPAADAEMIAMACAALDALGLAEKYRVLVNDRRLLDGLMEQLAAGALIEERARLRVLRAIDKLDRVGVQGVELLLGAGRLDDSGDFTEGAGLTTDQIKTVLDFLDPGIVKMYPPSGWLKEYAVKGVVATESGRVAFKALEQIADALTGLRLGIRQFEFEPMVVRGLEYYTGPVFEAQLLIETTDESGAPIRFGSVGGGGRYDDLVSRFKGQPIPATGFSIGVSRLAAALTATEEAGGADGPIVVLPFDAEAMGECLAIAAELRAKTQRPAEVYLGGSGPKAQLKYADKRAAPVAVIIGTDERAANQATVKDLKLGAALAAQAGEDREAYQALREAVQQTVPRAELAATVAAMLARGGRP